MTDTVLRLIHGEAQPVPGHTWALVPTVIRRQLALRCSCQHAGRGGPPLAVRDLWTATDVAAVWAGHLATQREG